MIRIHVYARPGKWILAAVHRRDRDVPGATFAFWLWERCWRVRHGTIPGDRWLRWQAGCAEPRAPGRRRLFKSERGHPRHERKFSTTKVVA